jgi:hypothetical protein
MTTCMQWRSGGGAAGWERDRVSDRDGFGFAADQDVADKQLQDACLLAGVHIVEPVCEPAGEALDGVGELEVVCRVVDLGCDGVCGCPSENVGR